MYILLTLPHVSRRAFDLYSKSKRSLESCTINSVQQLINKLGNESRRHGSATIHFERSA